MRIDSFANSSEGRTVGCSGIDISALERGSELKVRTRNSTYAMVVLSPSRQTVLIRGGNHFRPSTEATLLGSSSVDEIQLGRIATSSSLGILANGRGYVTSPIEAIESDLHGGRRATRVSPGASAASIALQLQQLFQLVAGGRVHEHGTAVWICPLSYCRWRIETSGDGELRDRLAIDHSMSHVSRARGKAA